MSDHTRDASVSGCWNPSLQPTRATAEHGRPVAAIAEAVYTMSAHSDAEHGLDRESFRAMLQDHTWALRSRLAVAECLGRVMTLMDDPAKEVVLTAALVLSRFRDGATEIAPLLQSAAMREEPGLWRAGIVALIGKLHHQPASIFLQKQTASENAAVRFAAHVALVLTLGENAPRDAIEQVRALRENEELIGEHLHGLPWDLYGELSAAELLGRIGITP